MPTCHGCACTDTANSGIATRDRPLIVPTIRPRLSSAGRCGVLESASGGGKCGVLAGETLPLCRCMNTYEQFIGTRPVAPQHAFDQAALARYLRERIPGFGN